MNSEQLRGAIGEVRDDFILDADTVVKKKKSHWPLWAAAAACLCLITMVAVKLLRRPAVNMPQQWSASIAPAEYFKNSKNGKDGPKGSSSASLVMLPYAVTVLLDEKSDSLEADDILPAMPDHPMRRFVADYHSDGSLYKVVFYWSRREGDDLTHYSDLHMTAAPKELHEISDVITVRTDENGDPLPADVTVTERDGVRIVAQGGEQEEKTLTWQTGEGWYQIGGSWNDSYEDMVALLDWFWAHPLRLDRFAAPPEGTILTVSQAEQPDAFREQVPDFSALGYTAEDERVYLWRRGDESVPIGFEGVYTRGGARIRWTADVAADADAWRACLGRPEEVTEKTIDKAVSESGSFNLFLFEDAPCMATVTVEQGTAADAWKIVQSLQN